MIALKLLLLTPTQSLTSKETIMAFEKVEFEFPNEEKVEALEVSPSSAIPVESENPTEIEIVDDTPEPDRNKQKSNSIENVSEDDLDDYSAKVQNRIKRLTKTYHDERREKEQILRERAELEQYTR